LAELNPLQDFLARATAAHQQNFRAARTLRGNISTLEII
jgi:hypothetical protein